ncbi:MAG: hypothetical protein D6731_17845 [Planctomycetota bacterium]|nr:MAG: hypothetical protein D6731_17845 [Planctomycetota bacterium]
MDRPSDGVHVVDDGLAGRQDRCASGETECGRREFAVVKAPRISEARRPRFVQAGRQNQKTSGREAFERVRPELEAIAHEFRGSRSDMADQRLREAERRAQGAGCVRCEAAHLQARVRAGRLDRTWLRLAARLGHPAARLLVDDLTLGEFVCGSQLSAHTARRGRAI